MLILRRERDAMSKGDHVQCFTLLFVTYSVSTLTYFVGNYFKPTTLNMGCMALFQRFLIKKVCSDRHFILAPF